MQKIRERIYSNEFYNSLSEIDVILEQMKITSLFPDKFIKFVKENKNYNYHFEYDINVTLKQQNITQTTKQILAILYSEYFCNTEQKEELEIIWRNNDKVHSEQEQPINNAMIEYSEPFFRKLLNKIKSLIKIKK